MSAAHRAPLAHARRVCRACGIWSKVLAATIIPWLVSLGGSARAQTVSPTAAVGGLEPKFADVKGVKTRYYDVGQGEPMVLVHGGGFAGYYSANVWSRNIPGLAKRLHVFAPDKLAAGMTDNPPDDRDLNIEGEVEHVYEFIQILKLGKVHLVGQSRGAGLALLLAMKYPDVVRTLVLVDSGTAAPQVGPSMHEILMRKCPTDPDESYTCEMRILSFKPEAFDEEVLAAAVYMGNQPKSKATMAKMAAGGGEPRRSEFNEWKKRLHERLVAKSVLPMPVLLYWGANDPQAMIPHAMALYEVLAGQHANVRLLFTNKAGHFHFREYPDEFNQNVISFVDYWRRQPATMTTSGAAPQTGAVDGLGPKFIDVKGVKTRYYETGEGEPMVLVHGGGFAGYYSANTWSRNLPGLGKRFHVFAPDKLAAGMTENPPADKDLDIEGETEHIYQFIQTMKLGRVHLIGQSRGAGLAWLLATKHPEVVRTLVLVDSQTAAPDEGVGRTTRASLMAPCPADRSENWKCEMRVLSFKPDVAFGEKDFAAGVFMGTQPKSKATMAKMAAGAGAQGLAQWNETKKKLHERLKAEAVLPMPVLMYWGYNDPQATRERALALFDILATQHPKVRMFFVNKAGHFLYREYPEEFNHTVMNFIDYWSRQPAATTSSR